MNTINPFSDPEFKKSILREEGINIDEEQVEEIGYEVLGEDEEENSFNTVISSAPTIPSQVKSIILDASQIARNEKEKRALELSKSLNNIFSRYNKEYSMNLSIDFNSFSNTLVNVSDPKSRRILELYLSEVFQSIRPVLILQMISRLSLAVDYMLRPENLLDENNLNLPDLFVACDKILDYIAKLEELKSDIIVRGSDLELQKMKDEEGNEREMTEEEKKTVENFMNLFKKDNGM